MSLETATYLADLVPTNPTGSDPRSQGDDHLRLIKQTLQNTLPGMTGPLDASKVPFTPVGNIAAANVQAAIAELDSEKLAKFSDTIQLGDSVTPANNFTLDASADNGTMKLARGNAGATTQDVMTVDADGKVAFPQNVVPVFQGAFASSGVASGNTPLPLTPSVIVGVTQAGAVLTPQVAGWYQCNLQLTLEVPGAGSLGAAITSSNGIRQHIQPPYSGNFAVVSVSDLAYCNGTSDTITFECFANVSGGSASNAQGSLVLVKRA
jgi:hypothetical protein